MSGQYILDENGEPVLCDDLDTWGRFMLSKQRILAQDDLGGGVMVSTVFLGLDYRYGGSGPPVLWETMVFAPKGHPQGGYQVRYCSREEALRGHSEVVKGTRGF